MPTHLSTTPQRVLRIALATTLLAATILRWLVLGLAWCTHIAMDRGFGYGLRDREGFQRAG